MGIDLLPNVNNNYGCPIFKIYRALFGFVYKSQINHSPECGWYSFVSRVLRGALIPGQAEKPVVNSCMVKLGTGTVSYNNIIA